MTNQFKVNATYQTRSICDHNCIFSYTVTRRTAKTVTLKSRSGKTRNCRVKIINGIETVFPEGRYSMCPVLTAEKLVA